MTLTARDAASRTLRTSGEESCASDMPGRPEDDGVEGGGAPAGRSLDALGADRIERLRVAPARRPVRRAVVTIVGVLVLAALVAIALNPRWEWGVVGSWFLARSIIRGLGETLKLTVLSGVLGFGLGLVLALMRLSHSRLASGLSWTFSWIFRSTPLLVQMLIWFNLGYLYDRIVVGVPFTNLSILDARTSDLMTPLVAAVLGLGLHQAAYASELIRGGILSVDAGQVEAASALGIPARDRNLRIVLPQAMRAILPSAFNEVIGLVKGTAIVYVIAHAELFFTVQLIYGRTQQVLPMLMVATLWYIVITSLLSIAQYYIERHFAKGAVRTLPPTPLQRLRANLTGLRSKSTEVRA
ncbi:amino acid ABC transporter permease [Brachybacterium halotolerans subsp. kimchii]|uniref:amino acid ABC transporter permease n=1 Tax=Brachybacterium halotolerans TaxID=2795215 RepID=UPI001E5CAF96|nr:amino acid ABC transporter permease [Brachybacterium halotolerans]UEJ82985.1 amino acid ABC transporter permease [Brachybacterium halotolerans subsp. kimchii]